MHEIYSIATEYYKSPIIMLDSIEMREPSR